MSSPIHAVVGIGLVLFGIPFAINQFRDATRCEATPALIEQVMGDLLPADYAGDKDVLKTKLVDSLSGTTDCGEIIKKIQNNILSQAVPEEMREKEGDGKITFKNEAEAIEYYRSQY